MGIHFVQLVFAGLQQDGHVQHCAVDQFGYDHFVAEDGQAEHQPIDPVLERFDVIRVQLCIRDRMHRAVGRCLKRESLRFDAQGFALGQHVACRARGQRRPCCR